MKNYKKRTQQHPDLKKAKHQSIGSLSGTGNMEIENF
jgi:hypothetical protein